MIVLACFFCFFVFLENGLQRVADQRLIDEVDADERDEVFTVEVVRGPRGLGLALVDGLVSENDVKFGSLVVLHLYLLYNIISENKSGGLF